MTVMDLFSGYGGFSIAAHRAGFATAAFSEVDPFACAVLEHRFPGVPNLGDVSKIDGANVHADIVTAGWPCQDVSIAGKRAGMTADTRSGLFYQVARIIGEMQEAGHGPAFFVGENVPGLLSSDGGRDFANVLSALAQLGAVDIGWRILDAQYFGVPQRRRRVFVVADFGDRRAEQILFEREGVRGNPAPSREAGGEASGAIAAGSDHHGGELRGRANASHRADSDTYIVGTLGASHGNVRADEAWTGRLIASALAAREGKGPDSDVTTTLIAHALRADGFDASEDGTGRGTPLVACYDDPRRFDARGIHRGGDHGDLHPPCNTTVPPQTVLAFNARQDPDVSGDVTHPLDTDGYTQGVAAAFGVRRITPLEAERLQGLPDNWTLVPYRGKPAKDGPRYRCIGNGVAVPVVEWIMRRIAGAVQS